MLQSLNLRQKEFFLEIVSREMNNLPYQFVLIGKAGTGKSRVLKSINSWLDHYHSNLRGNNPDVPYSIVCAYTGNAAFNCGGHTFHSSLGIRAMKGNDTVNGLMADKTLNHLMSVFSSIKHLSGDEFTYIGSSMLSKINRHLKLIKQNSKDDFGGLNIVLYGDPCQLGPIADRHIFEYDSKDPYGPISGGTLFDKFQAFELTEILRQSDIILQNALCDLSDSSNPMKKENVALFKGREQSIENIEIESHERVDLFATNLEVNQLNEEMIKLVANTPYPVEAILSIIGDETKSVKEKIKKAIIDRNDHTETIGLRLRVTFKVSGRYFIPVNVNLSDGLVNGAIGTLMSIDLDSNGNPVTLWINFDNDNVGVERRQMLQNCKTCFEQVKNGWTPIWKVSKNFSTCRKKLTGKVTMFPLYYAYGFTIAKAQGNSHIGISTVVHLNKKRKIPRKQLYVAMSRTDSLENLIIVGNFEDPWFREEETRKKSKIQPRQDEIRDGYNEFLSKKISLTWSPLYKEKDDSFIISFFNVNSLQGHIEDVQCDYSLRASDIIFLIDTRLKPGEEPSIPGQKFQAGNYMKKKKHVPGGLSLYSKPKYDILLLLNEHLEEKEYHFSIVMISVCNYIITGIYKSPRCPQKLFLKSLEKTLICHLESDQNVVVGGDFNFEGDIDFLIQYGFVRVPLKFTTKHESHIDQIYVKTKMSFKSGVNPTYYSDHQPTFLIFYQENSQCTTYMEVDCDISKINQCFKKNNDFIEPNDSPSTEIDKPNALTTIQTKPNRYQVRFIDRLNTHSSNNLILFLKKLSFDVINSNNKTQIGLSCGYICACIASNFYEMITSKQPLPIASVTLDSCMPDITLYNQILGISGEKAQLLESVQILFLISKLTGDSDHSWFYIMDFNMFKLMAASFFSNLSLPKYNGKRWGVFAVNDAVLNDQQRQNAASLNTYHGNHWYTALVWLD